MGAGCDGASLAPTPPPNLGPLFAAQALKGRERRRVRTPWLDFRSTMLPSEIL